MAFRRKIDDGIEGTAFNSVFQNEIERVRIPNIALHKILYSSDILQVPGIGQKIIDQHVMSVPPRIMREIRTDKSCAAGDEKIHFFGGDCRTSSFARASEGKVPASDQ